MGSDIYNRMSGHGVNGRVKCVFFFHWGNVSPAKALNTHRLGFPSGWCLLILPSSAQLSQPF